MRDPASSVLVYLASLARQLSDFGVEYIILVMLMELEIGEKYDGFEYLRTAIYIFCEEPERLVSQSLYSAVASQCGRRASEAAVERAIRTAIETAWKNHSEMWLVFFPSGERPSNIKFVARMAKYLELWKECCKVYKQQSSKEVAQSEK